MPVDLADILDQFGMALIDAGHRHGVAGLLGAARNLFQKPGAERIEFTDAGEIDLQARRSVDLRQRGIGQLFQ